MLRSVAVCILLPLAVPAWAADLPRVGVVGIHQASLDHADQQRGIKQLVAAIEASGRFDALTPAEVATTIAGRESIVLEEGLLAAGRQQLANGKNAYNQASPDDAIPYLESAIASFRSAFSGTNNADDLWETWIYLGTSHLQQDPPDDASAREALAEAIALSPTRPLNPALFPPNVIELFDQVQRELQGQVVSLEISTDLPADIWIDGIEKGPAPLTISGVIPGVHHLLARGDGKQGYVQLDVPPAHPATPTVPTKILLGPLHLGEASVSAAGRSNEVASTYLALGNRADRLEYLLVIGVSDSMLEVQLLNTATDTFSKPIELPYADDADDEAAQAVPLLLNGIDANGAFSAIAPVPAPIDIGSNVELALLLTRQIPPAAIGGVAVIEPPQPPKPKRSRLGLVLGVVGGALAAGAAGTGTYLLVQNQDGNGGEEAGIIVVQFR